MTTFRELREGFALTQADVAAALGISQPSVSQIEKREDMLVSTLAEMVRVLGFELVLVAHSTDCTDVRITFEAAKQHFQSLVPHTEQVVVPGVNHLLQMRDPKLIAAPIADFLSRQPL